MALKTINQQGVECDVALCDKFYLGEKPKSWKHVTLNLPDDLATDFDACSVKHARELAAKYVTIS